MTQNASAAANKTQSHTRVIDTMLGKAEKVALHWLAARMPAWVVPDTLTAIGLLASVIIFIGYALSFFNINWLWLASFGFILQWFGDSLDGTLARYRKIERPRYGFFVDHVIDAVSEALVFIGLGLSPFVRFDLALLALIGYLMVSVYVYLVTYVNGVFRISYAGLGPTEMRALAIIANTLVYFAPGVTVTVPAMQFLAATPLGVPVSLTIYDLVMIGVILLAVGVFTINSWRTAMELSLADRLALREKRLKERDARIARRKALRDERAMRKSAARAARGIKYQIPSTGRKSTAKD